MSNKKHLQHIFLQITVFLLLMGLWGQSLAPQSLWNVSKKQRYFCLQVLDADTLLLANSPAAGAMQLRLRLAYVDAPEKDQNSLDGLPVGQWARQSLVRLVKGRWISVQKLGIDRYGRTLGDAWVRIDSGSKSQEIGLNEFLLAQGWAILYPFAQFPAGQVKVRLWRAYMQAQHQRRGIWKTAGILSPYIHRKQQRHHWK